MELPMIQTQQRECGECTACCYVMTIKELDKSNYSHCEHENRGCNIYANRPNSCRSFACYWLTGHVGQGELHRPDKLGLMFTNIEARIDEHVGLYLCAYELTPGAAKQQRAAYLLSKLTKKKAIIIRGADYAYWYNGPEIQMTRDKSLVTSD